MGELFEPTLSEQIAEVRREIAMREHVYPRLIKNGVLSQAKADRAIEHMRAALSTLILVRLKQEQRDLDFVRGVAGTRGRK